MTHLEVSYHNGKLQAAYFYLEPRSMHSVRCKQFEDGLVVDFAADGRPIGIEIVSPSLFTVDALNRVMASLNLAPIAPRDLAPLVAA